MTLDTIIHQLSSIRIDGHVDVAVLGVTLGVTAAALLITAQVAYRLRRVLIRRRTAAGRRPMRADMAVTAIGAALVLALSVEGMWRFFGGIGMPHAARIAFAAVFEICLLAVALRSRHIRLQRQARRDALIARRSAETGDTGRLDAEIKSIRLRGINDVLVWVLAAVIGVLAALEAPTRAEQILRLLVPFVAATMWELALGADVEDQRVTGVAGHWIDRVAAGARAVGRFFVWVAIACGWAPPTSANASGRYREKIMTRLVEVSHQIHTAGDDSKTGGLRDRQRRFILDLQARGQWTRETMTELSERLDVLFRAVDLTAPSAVRPSASPVSRPADVPAARPAAVARPRTVSRPAPRPPQRSARPSRIDDSVIQRIYEELSAEAGRPPSARVLAAAVTQRSESKLGKTRAAEWIKNRQKEDS